MPKKVTKNVNAKFSVARKPKSRVHFHFEIIAVFLTIILYQNELFELIVISFKFFKVRR